VPRPGGGTNATTAAFVKQGEHPTLCSLIGSVALSDERNERIAQLRRTFELVSI
jgi:hypothetical protein